MQSAPRGVTGFFSDPLAHATMMAHINVQVRMQAAKAPAAAVPADTYLDDRRRKFHNGDAIELFYQPNAVTDGDSLVYFRRADVIVAGDIFTTTQYPFIDVKNGGSVQGEIQALNEILKRTVYRRQGEEGTYVVPGHGYLADEHEVIEYRDMVVIVRDRVKAMIARRRHGGAGEGCARDRGLRHALWRQHRGVDDGDVCRSGLCQPEGRPLSFRAVGRHASGAPGPAVADDRRLRQGPQHAPDQLPEPVVRRVVIVHLVPLQHLHHRRHLEGQRDQPQRQVSAYFAASRVVIVVTRSVPTTSCGARLKAETDTSTRRFNSARRRNCSS